MRVDVYSDIVLSKGKHATGSLKALERARDETRLLL